MMRGLVLSTALGALLWLGPAQAQSERQTPYWASISATKAMMRTGPGRNYPATWLYQRADLPVKIVETYPNWRKVQDPGGEKGWMLQRLLSDTRTALIVGTEPSELHEAADPRSSVRYRAQPGVVGRISKCRGGWCHFDSGGREGYIRVETIWGVDRGEEID